MEHQKISPCGSFKAWGVGLHYEYKSHLKSLNIKHIRSSKLLSCIDIDRKLAEFPLDFVRLIEKTAQIKALLFSNNKSLDISQTIDEARLSALVPGISRVSREAFDLEKGHIEGFDHNFCAEFLLKSLNIKRIKSPISEESFFSARLETQQCNSIIARSQTLHKTLSLLSENIIRDLVAKECSYDLKDSSHALVRSSHKLLLLSHIIDEDFKPSEKAIEGEETRAQTFQNRKLLSKIARCFPKW